MTKENVVFDTSASRFDLAIKEVEERVKLGWSVKASFLLGGGYLRVDYVRADHNRYKDVGKTNESVSTEIESSGYGGMGSVGCEEASQGSIEEATDVTVESTEVATPVEAVAEVKEEGVKETSVKPTRKTTSKKA